jgi:hypothetical protein
MTREELITLKTFLESTPNSVRQIVAGLSDDQLRFKPSATEFSALEHVCHLADIEREGYSVRVKRLLTEEMPMLSDIDGDRLARERDYNSQNLEDALSRFDDARRATLSALENQPLETLNNRGEFDGLGAITLAHLLEMMREHDGEHLSALASLQERLIERQSAEIG